VCGLAQISNYLYECYFGIWCGNGFSDKNKPTVLQLL